jgi:hypothetical protein
MHLGMYLHCGQLQLLNGSRTDPSQHKSLVHFKIGSHLQVFRLNVLPVIHATLLTHFVQLQFVNGLRAKPFQHRSAVQVLSG